LFVMSANETELARITKLPTETDEQVVAACRALLKTGVKNVLATLGSKGSVLLTSGGDVVRQNAFSVEKVVDTTGAGDCFRAAFAVAFVEGKNWQDCLRFASAASAICVTRLGAMPSMPYRAETLDLLASGKTSYVPKK